MNGAPFTDSDLLATIGSTRSAVQDFRDIVGLADLVTQPEAAIAELRSRFEAFPAARSAHQYVVSKPGSPEPRVITSLDVYEQVVYRSLAGRVVVPIEESLGNEVQSCRLAAYPPGWRVFHHGYGGDRNRAREKAFVDSDSFGAFATLDVRHFFPSISTAVLATSIAQLGGDDLAIADIGQYLDSMQQLRGVVGLPVGIDASGCLANATVSEVDAMLRGAGYDFSRFSDDYHLYLRTYEQFESVLPEARALLGLKGLRLHPKKVCCVETRANALRLSTWDDVTDNLRHALDTKDPGALSLAKVVFDREVEQEAPAQNRIKFTLGVFARRGDTHALDALQARDGLFDVAPSTFGQHLEELARKDKADRDWILSNAVGPTSPRHVCRRTYMLRALATTGRTPQSGRAALEDMLDDSTGHVLVRAAVAEALALTDGWRPGHAVSRAEGIGEPAIQRALALSVRHAPASRKRTKALAKLTTIPVCRASARWIADGAPSVVAKSGRL